MNGNLPFENDGSDDAGEESAPFWMISFGDMVTILLTFFVMLYSYSTMNTGKAEAVSTSLQNQFGTNATVRIFFSPEEKNRSMQEILPSKSLPIRLPQPKDINGIILFDENDHDLSEEAKKEIREIVPLLEGHDRAIELRGHANQNERGPFRDAMDLGYARAYNLRAYLIERGITPSRIRIYSLGEYCPVETEKKNDPAAGRCVEISVIPEPL